MPRSLTNPAAKRGSPAGGNGRLRRSPKRQRAGVVNKGPIPRDRPRVQTSLTQSSVPSQYSTSAHSAGVPLAGPLELDKLIETGRKDLDWRVERVWPDKDGRVRFEWTIRGAHGRRFSIFAVPWDPKFKECIVRGRLTQDGIVGLRAALPSPGYYVHAADTDPRLPQLAQCLDPEAMSGRLLEMGAIRRSGRSSPRVRPRLLAHKPGRRAAILYEISNASPRRLVGKTYRDDRAARVADWSRQVAEQLAGRGARLRVPEVVGVAPELRLCVSAWCAGEPGDRSPIEAGTRLNQIAQALAALHAIGMAGLPEFSPREECAIAERWATLLQSQAGHLATTMKRNCKHLVEWSQRLAPFAPGTIHRDFYEKQLIWSRGGPCLLDLDTLSHGDAALDVGNFIGHMLLNRATGQQSLACLPELAREFVGAYRQAGGIVESENVLFYWASSLVRGGAIHALRDATRAYAPAMWELAARIMKGRVSV